MSIFLEKAGWDTVAAFFSLPDSQINSQHHDSHADHLKTNALTISSVKHSSCHSLLQERVSTLKSCFHCDVMAVKGAQYFSSHDFEQTLLEQLFSLETPNNPSDFNTQEASDLFFLRLHQNNEQYLHFIDAVEEYTVELDEDSMLAQRDLQRLETKLDLVMQLLAEKNIENEHSHKNDLLFSYILTPQKLSLQLPLTETSFSAENTNTLLARLNTLLLEGRDERLENNDSLQGVQRELKNESETLERVFVFALKLHPLLNQSFYLAVKFNRIHIDSVSQTLMLDADTVAMSDVSVDALEKYIFRLHRRQLALQRQKRC